MIEIPALMFLAVCLVLLAGFPVALTLAGVGLLFAALGTINSRVAIARFEKNFKTKKVPKK